MYPNSYLWIESKRYLFVDEEAIRRWEGRRKGEGQSPLAHSTTQFVSTMKYLASYNFVYRDQTTH